MATKRHKRYEDFGNHEIGEGHEWGKKSRARNEEGDETQRGCNR
jgi:hypothetical protein